MLLVFLRNQFQIYPSKYFLDTSSHFTSTARIELVGNINLSTNNSLNRSYFRFFSNPKEVKL